MTVTTTEETSSQKSRVVDASDDSTVLANLSPDDWIRIDRQRWSNRRRIAFLSLYAIFVIIALMFVCVFLGDNFTKRANEISSILIAVIISLSGFVGAYLGLATWSDKFNRTADGGYSYERTSTVEKSKGTPT